MAFKAVGYSAVLPIAVLLVAISALPLAADFHRFLLRRAPPG